MNDTLRNTPEQAALAAAFRPTYGKPSPTTACPCCLPGHKGKSAYFFHRGTCGELVAMKCNNCGFIRTSKPRVAKVGQPTRAQQRALDRIERYYRERACGPVARFQMRATEYGTFWLTVETEGSKDLWRNDGAHLHIGKRGAVEVFSLYVFGLSKESEANVIASLTKIFNR